LVDPKYWPPTIEQLGGGIFVNYNNVISFAEGGYATVYRAKLAAHDVCLRFSRADSFFDQQRFVYRLLHHEWIRNKRCPHLLQNVRFFKTSIAEPGTPPFPGSPCVQHHFVFDEQKDQRVKDKTILQELEQLSRSVKFPVGVMQSEFLPCGNLTRYIDTHTVSALHVASLSFKIIFSLIAMQELGISHNDLTMNNILLKEPDETRSIYALHNTDAGSNVSYYCPDDGGKIQIVITDFDATLVENSPQSEFTQSLRAADPMRPPEHVLFPDANLMDMAKQAVGSSRAYILLAGPSQVASVYAQPILEKLGLEHRSTLWNRLRALMKGKVGTMPDDIFKAFSGRRWTMQSAMPQDLWAIGVMIFNMLTKNQAMTPPPSSGAIYHPSFIPIMLRALAERLSKPNSQFYKQYMNEEFVIKNAHTMWRQMELLGIPQFDGWDKTLVGTTIARMNPEYRPQNKTPIITTSGDRQLTYSILDFIKMWLRYNPLERLVESVEPHPEDRTLVSLYTLLDNPKLFPFKTIPFGKDEIWQQTSGWGLNVDTTKFIRYDKSEPINQPI